MNIAIIRNDKLGDFCLALPAIHLIKQYAPSAVITVITSQYTSDFARSISQIDHVLVLGSDTNNNSRNHFDAVVALCVEKSSSLFSWQRRIPYRLSPATKIWQFLYNNRLKQRRSFSAKPEYAYNLDLSYQFLYDFGYINNSTITHTINGDYLPSELTRPILRLPTSEIEKLRIQFCQHYVIKSDEKIIMVHPGSGGSANNLSLHQYAQLIQEIFIKSKNDIRFIISAGPTEITNGKELIDMLKGISCALLEQPDGIPGLARHIAFCNLFISNSTGPLHLAGLLNRPTAAFYPRHRSGSSLRWQTLNSPDRRLVFTPNSDADEKEVQSIDVRMAASRIVKFIQSLHSCPYPD